MSKNNVFDLYYEKLLFSYTQMQSIKIFEKAIRVKSILFFIIEIIKIKNKIFKKLN